jgi:hypothetical protein
LKVGVALENSAHKVRSLSSAVPTEPPALAAQTPLRSLTQHSDPIISDQPLYSMRRPQTKSLPAAAQNKRLADGDAAKKHTTDLGGTNGAMQSVLERNDLAELMAMVCRRRHLSLPPCKAAGSRHAAEPKLACQPPASSGAEPSVPRCTGGHRNGRSCCSISECTTDLL